MRENPPVKIMVLRGRRPGKEDEIRVCVIDHIERKDLPAAIGYFVLQFIDDFQDLEDVSMSFTKVRVVHLRGASNVRANALSSNEYGEVFDLIRQVETNERRAGG